MFLSEETEVDVVLSSLVEDTETLTGGKELNVDGASLDAVEDDESLSDRAGKLEDDREVVTVDDEAAGELESLSVNAAL